MSSKAKFGWNELATSDPDAAASFYGAVVGWTMTKSPVPGDESQEYCVFHNADGMVGGMMKMAGPMWEGIPPHWLSYITVEDVDGACEAAKANGGKVENGPFDIPTVGRMAVVTDPQGAAFALMAPFDDGAMG